MLTITEKEEDKFFYCYCSLITLLHKKKLSTQNIFLITLKSQVLQEVFHKLLSTENLYDICKTFIYYEPTIHTSKYVTRYINKRYKNS